MLIFLVLGVSADFFEARFETQHRMKLPKQACLCGDSSLDRGFLQQSRLAALDTTLDRHLLSMKNPRYACREGADAGLLIVWVTERSFAPLLDSRKEFFVAGAAVRARG